MKYLILFEDFKNPTSKKITTDYNFKPEDFIVLGDLLNVGKTKALGYLPINYINNRYGNPDEVIDNLVKYSKENDIIFKIKSESESNVSSGSIWMYNEKMLSEILEKYKDILSKDGIPIIPDEFVEYVIKHTVYLWEHPQSFVIIALTFNDKRFNENDVYDYSKINDWMVINMKRGTFKKFEAYVHSNYNVDMSNPIDLLKEYPDLFYSDPTPEMLKEFNKIISPHKNQYQPNSKPVKLYHGTSANINILKDGLLTTKNKTKKSFQSQTGYVYLSIFPDMAKTFGDIAYPYDDIVVYEVVIPVYLLQADKDQLYNKILHAGISVGDSLAESALYGHGFRVKGDIPPYMISVYEKYPRKK
jgi:hypothetical protein